MSTPNGMGETARTYAAAADLFAQRMIWLGELFKSHPHLRAAEAIIRPTSVDIVAIGYNGVEHDWVHALPPLERVGLGYYPIQSGLGEEDVLRTGAYTLHVRKVH